MEVSHGRSRVAVVPVRDAYVPRRFTYDPLPSINAADRNRGDARWPSSAVRPTLYVVLTDHDTPFKGGSRVLSICDEWKQCRGLDEGGAWPSGRWLGGVIPLSGPIMNQHTVLARRRWQQDWPEIPYGEP